MVLYIHQRLGVGVCVSIATMVLHRSDREVAQLSSGYKCNSVDLCENANMTASVITDINAMPYLRYPQFR
jgi:hypothetical protein